ncbi:thiamine phosphate synthase [Cyclobacterium marinum]|uniref:Thiamine monophosphate synthase n=2 Tax=Cyclobacterium marinum TaxID=104 RepID=G0J045_CYCMS|nr:thiamine phosphate synthase [Cyclobacterium marinum]AEL27306.1 thiamine monophosphate synthase [Cyclobacterium marinum DSM 745]
MKKLNLQSEKGIYLVIDPSDKPEEELFSLLEKLFTFPLIAVQIWDNFGETQDAVAFTNKVVNLASAYNFPILVNNRWDLLKLSQADGIHLDSIPVNLSGIPEFSQKNHLVGLTVNNDLNLIHQADLLGFDYVSFCSVYPTSTTQHCDLVSFESIRKAAEITNLPVFLAGGIKTRHLPELHALPYSGIAIISGVMQNDNPEMALQNYLNSIQKNQS